jgi:hypothetical protein
MCALVRKCLTHLVIISEESEQVVHVSSLAQELTDCLCGLPWNT